MMRWVGTSRCEVGSTARARPSSVFAPSSAGASSSPKTTMLTSLRSLIVAQALRIVHLDPPPVRQQGTCTFHRLSSELAQETGWGAWCTWPGVHYRLCVPGLLDIHAENAKGPCESLQGECFAIEGCTTQFYP